MVQIQIDLFTVIISAALNMVIGFFWYSKWLFGPTCLKLRKIDANKITQGRIGFVYSFIVSLVIAYFLAFFQAYFDVTTAIDGMYVGFCAWLGFVATTQISSVLWCNSPFKLFLIDTGGKLLSFVVMSGVIGA